MRPRDTDESAWQVQVAGWRRMSPAQRVECAAEMSEYVRELVSIGIRARHPEYGADEVRWALWRLSLGDDLFRRAYPAAPLVAP
jgi:hypothetical protein